MSPGGFISCGELPLRGEVISAGEGRKEVWEEKRGENIISSGGPGTGIGTGRSAPSP